MFDSNTTVRSVKEVTPMATDTSRVRAGLTGSWRRWILVGAIIAAFLLVAALGVAIAASRLTGPAVSTGPASADHDAVQQWWSGVREPVNRLQTALDNARRALDRQDSTELQTDCQRVHDIAEIELRAQLPSPDRQLTSELTAAIEDAHSAAHLCLAAVAGSPNVYRGDFTPYADR
jgi:hypothetical protein